MPLPKIIRSRRKTIALIVQPDGSLVVRAPQRATNRLIAGLIQQKAEWIRARQAQAIARPQPQTHRFTSGEHFWYLGSSYPLQVTEGSQDRLEFFGGQFRLSGDFPSFLPPAHGWEAVPGDKNPLREDRYWRGRAQALFVAWYRRQARQVLEERVALLARRGSFSYRQVKITSARTRWGSCSRRGTLSFPWRLVMAPLPVIDYVVMHELVHTEVDGHGKSFWEHVQGLVPDFKQHLRWLKQNGAKLEI